MSNQDKPELYEIIVHTPKGEVSISLNQPNFDQYQGAMLAMETPSGKNAVLYAGRFILTACVVAEDRDKLNQIEKDVRAHASASMDAYSLLNLYTSDLKKK
jgi:hypothetical protein